MAKVTTLPKLYHPLMEGASIKTAYCCVCGRTWPLNQHHVVKRSQGNLYRNGVKLPKPTLTLCGFGNNLHGPNGETWCHGLAHANRLHFRWVQTDLKSGEWWGCTCRGGHWEYLVTEEPVRYMQALKMDGWQPVKDLS